jgi:hypothetical protein
MFRTISLMHWLVAASTALAAGCSIETRPAAYPARPVIYETAQPAVIPAPEPVVVEAPPAPPPSLEPIPPPPSPDHEWIAGHYERVGPTYVWHRARYERRPHPHARYVPGHWERRGRGRIWIEGRWN